MQGGLPNTLYVDEVWVAELGRIKQPAYFTNVKRAFMPDFSFNDREAIIQEAVNGPTFMIWPNTDAGGDGALGRVGFDWVGCQYAIVGAAIGKDVKRLVRGMANDLWRVARGNNNRCHPDSGTTSNGYCRGTQAARQPNIVYDWDKTDQNHIGFGMFDSFWICEVACPWATG